MVARLEEALLFTGVDHPYLVEVASDFLSRFLCFIVVTDGVISQVLALCVVIVDCLGREVHLLVYHL